MDIWCLNQHTFCPFINILCLKAATFNMFKQWQIPEGNGSGVIWDKEGHIVTNYHGKITSNMVPECISYLCNILPASQ